MKHLALLALPTVALSAMNGFASEGVIMKHIQKSMSQVMVPNDVVATVNARLGYAMGVYSAENRIHKANYSPDASQSYVFQKKNDANAIQTCVISFDQLASGVFNPSCR